MRSAIFFSLLILFIYTSYASNLGLARLCTFAHERDGVVLRCEATHNFTGDMRGTVKTPQFILESVDTLPQHIVEKFALTSGLIVVPQKTPHINLEFTQNLFGKWANASDSVDVNYYPQGICSNATFNECNALDLPCMKYEMEKGIPGLSCFGVQVVKRPLTYTRFSKVPRSEKLTMTASYSIAGVEGKTVYDFDTMTSTGYVSISDVAYSNGLPKMADLVQANGEYYEMVNHIHPADPFFCRKLALSCDGDVPTLMQSNQRKPLPSGYQVVENVDGTRSVFTNLGMRGDLTISYVDYFTVANPVIENAKLFVDCERRVTVYTGENTGNTKVVDIDLYYGVDQNNLPLHSLEKHAIKNGNFHVELLSTDVQSACVMFGSERAGCAVVSNECGRAKSAKSIVLIPDSSVKKSDKVETVVVEIKEVSKSELSWIKIGVWISGAGTLLTICWFVVPWTYNRLKKWRTGRMKKSSEYMKLNEHA